MDKLEALEKELDAMLDEIEKINIMIYQEKLKIEKLHKKIYNY